MMWWTRSVWRFGKQMSAILYLYFSVITRGVNSRCFFLSTMWPDCFSVSCLAGVWMTTSGRWWEARPMWARMADRWAELQVIMGQCWVDRRKMLYNPLDCPQMLIDMMSVMGQVRVNMSVCSHAHSHSLTQMVDGRSSRACVPSQSEMDTHTHPHRHHQAYSLSVQNSISLLKLENCHWLLPTQKNMFLPLVCSFLSPHNCHGKGQDDSDPSVLLKLPLFTENTPGK